MQFHSFVQSFMHSLISLYLPVPKLRVMEVILSLYHEDTIFLQNFVSIGAIGSYSFTVHLQLDQELKAHLP